MEQRVGGQVASQLASGVVVNQTSDRQSGIALSEAQGKVTRHSLAHDGRVAGSEHQENTQVAGVLCDVDRVIGRDRLDANGRVRHFKIKGGAVADACKVVASQVFQRTCVDFDVVTMGQAKGCCGRNHQPVAADADLGAVHGQREAGAVCIVKDADVAAAFDHLFGKLQSQIAVGAHPNIAIHWRGGGDDRRCAVHPKDCVIAVNDTGVACPIGLAHLHRACGVVARSQREAADCTIDPGAARVDAVLPSATGFQAADVDRTHIGDAIASAAACVGAQG